MKIVKLLLVFVIILGSVVGAFWLIGSTTGSGLDEPSALPTTAQTFRCDECNSEFPSLASLQEHKNKVHSPKGCKYCQQQFKGQEALKAHLKEKHHFVCNECGSDVYFATQKELEAHKRGKRKNGKPHDR